MDRAKRAATTTATPGGESAVVRVLDAIVRDHCSCFQEAHEPPRVATVDIVSRRLSDIARAELEIDGARVPVYVKIHKKAGRPPEHVRRKVVVEFETLRLLDRSFRSIVGGAVPRPVAMFPEHFAVVTHAAVGKPLHWLIRRGMRIWSGAAEAARLRLECERAGWWLRTFQDITMQPRWAPFPVVRLIDRLRTDLDTSVALGMGRAEANRILDFCSLRLERLAQQELPVCGVHPDFQPDNVLIADGLVTVLDFTDFHHGPPYGDPGRFLASLAFFCRSPLYRPARVQALMTAFLRGYRPGVAQDESLLEVSFVRFLVRATASVASWRYPLPIGIGAVARRQAVGFLTGWESRLGMLRQAMREAAR